MLYAQVLPVIFANRSTGRRKVGKNEGRYTSGNSELNTDPMRAHPLFLALAAGTLASAALAFDQSDPFATEAITPPRPLLSPLTDSTPAPCRERPAGTTYGVLEVVDVALCQNPKTRESWANARAQAAQVGLAQADFLPALDGKIGLNRSNSSSQRSASLTLSWLLFDFGARSASLENARQLLSAAASTLDASVQTVFLTALQSYYNAQAARAAVSAALQSEKASRASLTAAEVRYTVGTGTPADRLQAQTAWSQATLNRIRAEGTLKNAYGALANVMGLDASLPLGLAEIGNSAPDASFERDIDALIAEARDRRPDLKAAEAQVKAARASIDSTRASSLPSVSLSAGPSWVDNGNVASHSSSIGLTLSVPLFSGFDSSYKLRAAQARADAALAQRDNVRLQVALDVWTAYQNLTTASQTLRTSADLLASAEQSERVALGRYKAGVGTILDLLNAQSALAAARVQGIQAQLDWNVSRASLARAVGTLDSRLLQPAAELKTP